eukprot:gene6908-11071_t
MSNTKSIFDPQKEFLNSTLISNSYNGNSFIISKFTQLYNDETGDIEFHFTSGNVLKCHSNILSIWSYFKTILDSNMIESKKKIKIEDDENDFRKLIFFLHSERIYYQNFQDLIRFILLYDKYQIGDDKFKVTNEFLLNMIEWSKGIAEKELNFEIDVVLKYVDFKNIHSLKDLSKIYPVAKQNIEFLQYFCYRISSEYNVFQSYSNKLFF